MSAPMDVLAAIDEALADCGVRGCEACCNLRKSRAAIAELIAASGALVVLSDGRSYFESGANTTRFRAALAACGGTQAAVEGEGPEYSDGHDHEGFPGGCARFGHRPEDCPTRPPTIAELIAERERWKEDRAIAEAFREVVGPDGGRIQNAEIADYVLTRAKEISACGGAK